MFVKIIITLISVTIALHVSADFDDSSSLPYLWPLPAQFTYGDDTLSVDPDLSLSLSGDGGRSVIAKEAFDRYKRIIFKHSVRGFSLFNKLRGLGSSYDIGKLSIVVHSDSEELQLGVDESYTLLVAKNDGQSIIGEAAIEANTIYGALRGLEVYVAH